jgi:DUF1365 family protein
MAPGFILENRVTHIRGLPVSSSHAFRYSTLSFLLGLDSLESGRLDLASGWLFGYGGRWGRILGLRSEPYLDTLSSASIRRKLELELRRHSLLSLDETFQDAWLMTMPSVLGFEGINPLTVYFCYKNSKLWTVVLEVRAYRSLYMQGDHTNIPFPLKDTQHLQRRSYSSIAYWRE